MTSILGIKKFPIEEFAISGNAILGIRDSGKTFAGCEAAEELFDYHIPSICFDPIGKWHSLRVPGKGKGYPFVVAGGRYGDLPLTRKNAADLVRAAMKDGISLVIDLFSREMTKADWRYIVQTAMEILLFENEDFGLRHIFLEEAGEFVPQIVNDGATFNAVEKVIRMGGNSKLGCTLIHQRPADINKSVLELCANVILLKQSGKNTVTDLKKWAQLIAPDQAAKIGSTLPHLKPGHGWAFIAGIPEPFQFQVPPRNSKHPDRRDRAKVDGVVAREAVPATKFVEAMKAKLAPKDPPTGAPAPPATAHAKSLLPAQAKAVQRDLDAASREGFTAGAEAMRALLFGQLEEALPSVISDAARAMTKSHDGLLLLLRKINTRKSGPQPQGSPLAPLPARASMGSAQKARPAPNPADAATVSGLAMPKGERIVLTAIAQHPDGCTRQQLTVLTGYKKTSRDTYLQKLAQRGFTEQGEDRVRVTRAGIDALGSGFEPLPTGDALREHVLHTLPQGERRVLEVAIEFYPEPVERAVISERTAYQKTSRDTYIQKLAARELVQVERGAITASANLF